jgi:hypothetical protein
MTPTRLELGGVPCMLNLRSLKPFPSMAAVNYDLRLQIIFA